MTPDIVIMDVGLPDLDGREAVKQLRRDGFRRPIVMLTAHDSDADTVEGSVPGRTTRRQALPLRRVARPHPRAAPPVRSERGRRIPGRPYTFRPTSKNLVDAKGVKLRLTEKEAAILRFLHRADQQPVPRETC